MRHKHPRCTMYLRMAMVYVVFFMAVAAVVALTVWEVIR